MVDESSPEALRKSRIEAQQQVSVFSLEGTSFNICFESKQTLLSQQALQTPLCTVGRLSHSRPLRPMSFPALSASFQGGSNCKDNLHFIG
jgi:hypothetical protein